MEVEGGGERRADIPPFSAPSVYLCLCTDVCARDKHGKRDTAGHAVHVNTAELRDTAKLKLLSPSWNRAAMRLG